MSENVGWYERIFNWLRFRPQAGTPSTPAPNDWKLYFKSDGLYMLNGDGTESVVGGGTADDGGGGDPDTPVATDPIWTAPGQLVAGTKPGQAKKVDVGADGTVLTADSLQEVGVKWAAVDSGEIGVWSPDAAPDSAHAKGDEFNDSSLDAKWTEWDVSGTITVAESSYGLSLTQPTQGAEAFGGIYQAVPASGDWAAWTKVSVLTNRGNYFRTGLALLEDAAGAPSTCNLCALELCFGYLVRLTTYTQYNDAFGSQIAGNSYHNPHAYLRIRKDSTTYYFDYSADGIGWYYLTSRTVAQLGYTPAQFALVIDNYNSGVDLRSVFPFFRVQAATLSHTAVMNGNRI